MRDIGEILRDNGFRFQKRFGQNFIYDGNLLNAIVAAAGVGGQTTVLEIGAGAGSLTRALASAAKRVVSFEIDGNLKPVLCEVLAECPNAEVRFQDFMKADLSALEREIGDYVVVANLPYYVTTPVVMRFVEEAARVRSLTVMVQEEVAERFCAEAGSAQYGAVTAAIARRGECRTVRRVSRAMFTPRPNVDSAVVRIDFEEGRIPVESAAAYRQTVRCAFLSRRKTLENNLIAALSLTREEAKDVLCEAGVAEGARGETLSPEELARLSDLLYERGAVR